MRNYCADPIIDFNSALLPASDGQPGTAAGPAPEERLRAILAQVFDADKAQALTRIVLRKRYSSGLVENRLRELEQAIGKEQLPIVLRRSPFIIYAGSADYRQFVARQTARSETRRQVLAAISEAGIGPLAPEVEARIALQPGQVAATIAHCREHLGDGWQQALCDKAGPAGRFFLKCPGQQRKQIDALARSSARGRTATATRQTLVAAIADYVGPAEARRLVALYLDGIGTCSLATAIHRLDVLRSLGRPHAPGWRRLPWSAFFCDFEAFASRARDMLGAGRQQTAIRARIRALVGQQVGQQITARCRLQAELERAEQRLLALGAEFGQQVMVEAARDSLYIFAGSPKHFEKWLATYRQKRARAAGKQARAQQIEKILIDIFGVATGQQLARSRTLAPETVLARIDQLKSEHPQTWQTIVRTHPSAMLSVSRAKSEQEILAFLYDARRNCDEASLPQAMRAIFNRASCERALEKKRSKRLSAEMMMERLSELEVLKKIDRQLVPASAAWILVVETRAWKHWLEHRKAKARLISLIKEYQTDPQRARQRAAAVARSYRPGKLHKILARLDTLKNSQGEPAVADAVRFSWVALTMGSDACWRRTVSKERYQTVPIAKTFERVAHRYHLAAEPPLQVTKTGKFIICPESRQYIRLFENADGEIRVRYVDLPVMNLYLRLFCLADPRVSRKEAYRELDRLKSKAALRMQERVQLWMIRSYALASHDIELTKLLDQRALRLEFEKGLPCHPDYGTPYCIDAGTGCQPAEAASL